MLDQVDQLETLNKRKIPLVIRSLDIGHWTLVISQVGNQKHVANLAKLTNLANLEVHWSFPVHSHTVPQSPYNLCPLRKTLSPWAKNRHVACPLRKNTGDFIKKSL
jgi:hypothetical protein